jgi:hypothetical protein
MEQRILIAIDEKLVEKSRQHSNDQEELFISPARPHELLKEGINGGGTESQTP